MPYGQSETDYGHPSVTMYNYYPNGLQVVGPTWSMNSLEKLKWRRSGTNTFPLTRDVCRRYTGPLQLVPVNLYNGPKLPYKVFVKKLNRHVWARQHIVVWKLVKAPTKVKSAKGLNLVPNPLSFESVKMTVMPNSQTYVTAEYPADPSWRRTYIGDLYDGFVPVGGSSPLPLKPNVSYGIDGAISGLEERANDRALAKLYAAVNASEVNLLNAIAERRQTVQTLATLVERLAKALFRAKRGRFVDAALALFPTFGKSPSKDIANDFLMYQYGVKPLISDINGVIDHLNKWEPLEFDVKVSATEKPERSVVSVDHTNACRVLCTKEVSGKCQVTYKVRLRTRDSFHRNLARLGLTNLNATAWELIPWSFIIDWVISIGSYLDHRDAFDGMEVVFCTKTIFQKEDAIFSRSFGGLDSGGYRWESAKSQVVVQKVLANRQLLTSIPPLPFPSAKNPFSFPHMANALALLRQLSRS